jgi:hypothetical protein
MVPATRSTGTPWMDSVEMVINGCLARSGCLHHRS